MLDPVDKHDHLLIVNLVDNAVVTAPGRMEAIQFPEQRLSKASRILRNRAKDGRKACFPYVRR
jgi:hypothetical protein